MRATPETTAIAERIEALRQRPDDPQAILQLSQCLETLGREHLPEADRLCADLIARFPHSPLAGAAKVGRTRIAQASVRCVDHGALRMDVVQYIADAQAAFDALGPRQRELIALEIAKLGEPGLDIHDPTPKYTLKTMSGNYSGLHLLAILYTAFRQIDPTIDIGADFLREYEMARMSAK